MPETRNHEILVFRARSRNSPLTNALKKTQSYPREAMFHVKQCSNVSDDLCDGPSIRTVQFAGFRSNTIK